MCYIHLSLTGTKAWKRGESHLPVEQRLKGKDLNAGFHHYLISKNKPLEASKVLSILPRGYILSVLATLRSAFNMSRNKFANKIQSPS